MGQKEPYENQQGQTPSPAPGRLWAGDCLPGWTVALQKRPWGLCQTVSWEGANNEPHRCPWFEQMVEQVIS